MRRIRTGLVLLSAAGMLGAAALAETKVEVTNVHLCCPGCVKAVGSALKGVEGVTGVCDQKAKTVTITAPDDATAQKARSRPWPRRATTARSNPRPCISRTTAARPRAKPRVRP